MHFHFNHIITKKKEKYLNSIAWICHPFHSSPHPHYTQLCTCPKYLNRPSPVDAHLRHIYKLLLFTNNVAVNSLHLAHMSFCILQCIFEIGP